jgi:hypothetical protein
VKVILRVLAQIMSLTDRVKSSQRTIWNDENGHDAKREEVPCQRLGRMSIPVR